MNASPSGAPLLRRALVLLLCCAVLSTLGTPLAAQAQSSAEGAVAYTVAAPDTNGGYVVDGLASVGLDGSAARTLPGSVQGVPQWSPDGRWLAATQEQDGRRQPVAVAAADDTVVTMADEGADPSWAADGSLVMWVATVPTPQVVIAQVERTDPDLALGTQSRIDLPQPAAQPRLSPDGTTVVFRMRPAGGSGADLWTVRTNGSGLRQLTSGVDVSVARPGTHSWSPDGGQIVFLGADAASRGLPRAHIIMADGTGQRLLFPDSRCEYQHDAAWAPHGEYLAVLQSCQSRGFFIVTPQGKSLGRVGFGPRRFGGFAFSGDATLLYAAAMPELEQGATYTGRLHAIPLDGSTPRALTDDPPVALDPIDVVTTSEVVVRVVMPPRDDEPDPQEDRPELEHSCPEREVPYADFLDVGEENPHRLAIDCMAWWSVVRGVDEYAYGPSAQMTRAQMASLLVRLIASAGTDLPGARTDHFDDDQQSVHQDNINRLADVGILQGSGSRRFVPQAAVRRDQMATFIIAAYQFVSGVPLEDATADYFSDDNGNVHEGAIDLAAEAGFVAGLGDGRYGPSQQERRDQAASRAARMLDALVEQGTAERPAGGLAQVTRVVDGDTFLANVPGTGTVRVRLIGLQAPESGTCNARAARLSLRDMILNRAVRLSSDDPASTGNELRPLRFAEVYTDGAWLDVGGEQLRRGHAIWLPKAREPRNTNAYQLAVREAMAQRVNLWNPTACGHGPDQSAVMQMWVESNPPGRDAANLNGEWVRIHNTGATTVDLAGWYLRDSSLRRPLQFTSDSEVHPGETMTVHVGSGTDERLVRYWGWDKPLFTDPTRIAGQWIGDGAYLQDGDGDIRAYFIYPCIGECTDPLLGRVEITRVRADAPGDTEWPNGEFVKITNASDRRVSLYGYQLRAAPHLYDFPPDSAIAPGETLTVYIGHGQDGPDYKFWGNDTEILDDADGLVVLRTYDRIRISCRAWGAGECR